MGIVCWMASAMEPKVQSTYVIGKLIGRTVDRNIRRDRLDGKRLDRRLALDVEFGKPTRKLVGGTGVDDPAQSHQSMGSTTHRTVLSGRVDRGTGTFAGGEIGGRPARQRKFRMLRLITSGGVIVIFGKHLASFADQYRSERGIAGFERLPGKLDATTEKLQISVGQHSRMLATNPVRSTGGRGNGPHDHCHEATGNADHQPHTSGSGIGPRSTS